MERGKKTNARKWVRRVALIVLAICLVLYAKFVSIPFVADTAQAMARLRAVEAINRAAVNMQSLEAFYGEYYEFERNQEGEIVLIRANTAQINRLNLMAQNEVQAALDGLNQIELPLKLGAYSGSALLADLGPTIHVQVKHVGTALANIRSEFYEQGINQTVHRMVLEINTVINLLLPIRAEDIVISTQLVLAEHVIVGRVPDSYITGIGSDEVLNLVP